ncbi:hypothetical protein HCC36_16055 [Listeria booriae]|uniref:Uncharacterized protein n=1 Tax=Listeria booriae TaxID=1552123 RepID=A0A842GCX6_9LIST|nr:hypothetical protein [Listeria booriae]MBC2294737.1 hypothetical protein [Listeria booriae]
MSVLKVVKKPIIAKAVQFTGDNSFSINALIALCGSVDVYEECFFFKDGELFVRTLEGEFRVTKGSYVIKGNFNEFWAIKEHIFNETYEIT